MTACDWAILAAFVLGVAFGVLLHREWVDVTEEEDDE